MIVDYPFNKIALGSSTFLSQSSLWHLVTQGFCFSLFTWDHFYFYFNRTFLCVLVAHLHDNSVFVM